jgi:hypothetical protein
MLIGHTISIPGQGGAPFNPGSVGGGTLVLWLRADRGITLNGGDVSGWNDFSGLANNVAQANGPNQPLYVASNAAFANQPTVRFTSANTDALTTASGTLVAQSGARTIICAVRATDAVGGTIIDFQRDATDFAFIWFDNAGTKIVFTDATVTTTVTAPPVMPNTAYVMTFVDSGTGTALVWRANQTGYATVGNIPAETAPPGGFSIGNRAASGFSFQGDIAEILVYASALSAADYTTVENYMRGRYAI